MNEMSKPAEHSKLTQMINMLLFYHKTNGADLQLAQAISQILGLALEDGCPNFEKFIERTVKQNQKQPNFKLPIFYNKLRQNEEFSAENLVKMYMQNYAFGELGRDVFGKAIPDFYHDNAFMLNDFEIFQELCKTCADEDFSGVELEAEQLNLKQMKESLAEQSNEFSEYLQQSERETVQQGVSSLEEGTDGPIEAGKFSGVFKNIGKLIIGITGSQVREEEKIDSEPLEKQEAQLLDFDAPMTMEALDPHMCTQSQEEGVLPTTVGDAEKLAVERPDDGRDDEYANIETHYLDSGVIDEAAVVQHDVSDREDSNENPPKEVGEKHSLDIASGYIESNDQVVINLEGKAVFDDLPSFEQCELETAVVALNEEVGAAISSAAVQEVDESVAIDNCDKQNALYAEDLSHTPKQIKEDKEENHSEPGEIEASFKLSGIFEFMIQRVAPKPEEAPAPMQSSGISVADVIEMSYSYRREYGETQLWATLVYTILTRIFAGTRELRQFVDETCKLHGDNKNFRLKLFCAKEYQHLGDSLQISMHIIQSYLINYMIELLYGDIYSKLVVVFYPPDSILNRDPLAVKDLCDSISGVDFNQFELKFDKNMIEVISEELSRENAPEGQETQHIEPENHSPRPCGEAFELQLEETDFISEVRIFEETGQELQKDGRLLEESSSEIQIGGERADDGSFLSSSVPARSATAGAERGSLSRQDGSQIDLRSSSDTSSSEETLTGECAESLPFDIFGANATDVVYPISYEKYQKYNNSELFCGHIEFCENYFFAAPTQHVAQIEKAVAGKKLRTQPVEARIVKSFTILTQGPLQFPEYHGIKTHVIVFETPAVEGKSCEICDKIVENGFYCFGCDRCMCADHEQHLTILPEYCIMGLFQPLPVCLDCHAAAEKMLSTIFVKDSELMIQVVNSPGYTEGKQLRLILLHLDALDRQQRPQILSSLEYRSDLDYYRHAEMEEEPPANRNSFNNMLCVREMEWTFLDIAGFEDGSVRQQLVCEIKALKHKLANLVCGCGASLGVSRVGVCQRCHVLRCSSCLETCCSEKE